MESNNQLKPTIGSAYQLLKQNNYYYYFKKVVLLFFELLSYVIFLVLLFCVFSIPNNPLSYEETINNDLAVHTTLKSKELYNSMVGLKAILFLIPIFFLGIGIFLGYIRRKNNRIRQAVLYLEDALGKMY
jgi:hypothetical protein